jgi:hypothetical protein
MKSFDRIVCGLGALGLLLVGLLLEWRISSHLATQLRLPALAVWLCFSICVVAALLSGGWFQRAVKLVTLMAINTGLLLGLVEGGCRLLKIDFNEVMQARQKNMAFPPYFRQATKPVGDIFFTRYGPDAWTGKPLTTMLKCHQSTDVAYTDEKELTINYGKEGFRNPEDLTDWDIAIAGDSFVESGYLLPEQTFVGLMAQHLGKRIKNLGITNTGNFSASYYLTTYGKAPSNKLAVLAFFEGNDVSDGLREVRDREKLASGGERPSREIGVEPSLLKCVYKLIADSKGKPRGPRSYINAYFKGSAGEIPVTIAEGAPEPAALSPQELAALRSGFDAWVQACKDVGVEPWLLYLPCKRHALHGSIRHGQDYPSPDWQPTKLPSWVQTECVARGIRFVDATPALIAKSKAGILTYNTIYDTHFNEIGHQVVAEVLAASLGK